ncbi:MFS transporter [Nocardia sp. NPDC051750]|uniref:MFS transporter n=1 Tax=Nocardia sp. NPDC051750 TaxID=3364325 RepID=UPI0037973C33
MSAQAAAVRDPLVTISSPDDVERIIDEGGVKGKSHWIILGLALAGLGFEAFYTGALSGGMSALTEQLGLSGNNVGTLSAIGYSASVLAALTCAKLGDRIGRVRFLVIAKALAVIGALVMMSAQSYGMLLSGRLIGGIAYGIDLGIALAYLAELLPKNKRNWLSFSQAQWYTSTSLALLVTLGAYELGAGLDVWRWSLGVAGAIAFVLLLARIWYMPESPKWLAARGDLDGAARSLTRILGREVRVDTARVAAAVPAPAIKVKWAALWAKEYRQRTILANIVGFTEALQYFAIGFYLPVISMDLFGSGFAMAITGSIVFNLFGIVGGVLAVYFARRFGVRISSAWGFAGVATAILILATWSDMPLLAGFLVPSFFIFCHAAAPGTAGLTMGPLAYRSELRARGSQLVTISRSAAGVVGLFCFPVLREAFGTPATLLILMAAPLAGLLACLIIKWEPLSAESDQELHEIGVRQAHDRSLLIESQESEMPK